MKSFGVYYHFENYTTFVLFALLCKYLIYFKVSHSNFICIIVTARVNLIPSWEWLDNGLEPTHHYAPLTNLTPLPLKWCNFNQTAVTFIAVPRQHRKLNFGMQFHFNLGRRNVTIFWWPNQTPITLFARGWCNENPKNAWKNKQPLCQTLVVSILVGRRKYRDSLWGSKTIIAAVKHFSKRPT